jgi:hypothetical protein
VVTRLVLWDIDGTLMDAAGFGSRMIERAFLQVCGAPMVTSVPLAGRTDRAINLDVLAAHGREPGDLAGPSTSMSWRPTGGSRATSPPCATRSGFWPLTTGTT